MRRLGALAVVPLLLFGGACGDDDDEAADGAAFCTRAESLDGEFSKLEDLGGETSPSSEDLAEAASAVADLADGSPSEIRDDLETFAETLHEFSETIEGVDLTDGPAVRERLGQHATELLAMGEDLGESGKRIQTYLQDECGLDVGDDVAPETTGTTEG